MCDRSATLGGDAVTHETTFSPTTDPDTGNALRAYIPPGSTLCAAAFDLIMSALPLSIVHHSIRVYLFANWLDQREESQLANSELLFVACVCHDLGASHKHDGPQRFEIEGADVAAALLRDQGKSQEEAHDVWTAIALHTSPGIAERITPLARLVRLGVLMDFRPATRESLDAIGYGREIESKLPRLEIEKLLGDAVVHQAILNPQKAPAASWPNNLYKSYLENPEWTGVNIAF